MNKFYKDKQKIINWLDEHEVKNYILVPDEKYGFIVNVNGDVDLSFKELINIPIKFSKVNGSFGCHDNKLTSLEFCPKKVGGSFYCDSNKLTSLEFCTQAISGSFGCYKNQLRSLEFSPQTVGGSFLCSENQLRSLEFCPQMVGGNFYCENNPELKNIQEITDFKLIYLEHKKTLITKLSDKLENALSNDKSKKTAKIKI